MLFTSVGILAVFIALILATLWLISWVSTTIIFGGMNGLIDAIKEEFVTVFLFIAILAAGWFFWADAVHDTVDIDINVKVIKTL